MDAWVPLFQTLLWVLLIGGGLWRYHAQVADVLEAIRDRVRKGSKITTPFFELGESPPVQSEESQKRELLAEVRDATDQDTEAPLHLRFVYDRAFLAEELAVRELQSEFGVSINRHVAVGPDAGLDGMFAKDGRGYGIEIKFTRRPLPQDIARNAVQKLQLHTTRLGWRRFTLVLAVIHGNDDADLAAEQARIEAVTKKIGYDVIVRVYSFSELARKFGMNDGG